MDVRGKQSKDRFIFVVNYKCQSRKPHRAAAELIRLQYEIAVFTSVYVDTADGVILSDEVYRFSSVYRHTVRLKFGLYHGGRCAVFRRCFFVVKQGVAGIVFGYEFYCTDSFIL